ncbi:MAG: hypothetical protein ABR523_10425, partial [Desulfurivibrionaceae bacterium]
AGDWPILGGLSRVGYVGIGQAHGGGWKCRQELRSRYPKNQKSWSKHQWRGPLRFLELLVTERG